MIELRPAARRFHTRLDWLDSWHSFSFGTHYDPRNMGHGLLRVHNDDRVAGGGGFGTHSHRDMEIVTWVLAGELEHRDSEGNHGRLHPGLAQRMSAGTGIAHSEMNPSPTAEVHFVQMWVPPDREGLAPGYEQRDVTAELDAGGLVKVAGPDDDAAVLIHQRDATLWVARLASDEAVTVPAAPHVHLFVALGDARGGGAELAAGDALRLTDEGSIQTVAGPTGAELVVWATR